MLSTVRGETTVLMFQSLCNLIAMLGLLCGLNSGREGEY